MSLHGIAADYLWSDGAEKTPRPLNYFKGSGEFSERNRFMKYPQHNYEIAPEADKSRRRRMKLMHKGL